MEIIQFFIDLLQDPRGFIADWISNLGAWAYAPIALIIFVETGVVIMPWLPGDSLLFTAGIFAAEGGGLSLAILLPVCWIAAIIGDQCNYWIGREFGKRIIDSRKVKALTPERLEKTHAMIDKYGPLAVFLGRFFPFIRTFVPFIAGCGRMHYQRFFLFNIIGGIVWSSVFILLGYFFGNIPFVQEHFEWIIIGIVVVSVIPTVAGLLKAKFGKKNDQSVPDALSSEEGAKPSNTFVQGRHGRPSAPSPQDSPEPPDAGKHSKQAVSSASAAKAVGSMAKQAKEPLRESE